MTNIDVRGKCSCGDVTFEVQGPVLFRALCHCSICQAYNQAPFGDITLIRSKHVSVNNPDHISYRSHKFPPLVHRGHCATCEGVALEKLVMPGFPAITILPAQLLDRPQALPSPAFHMFYGTHVMEAEDTLPKYQNYLRSQLAFTTALLSGLRRSS